jgi:hypothetical protein
MGLVVGDDVACMVGGGSDVACMVGGGSDVAGANNENTLA